MTARPGPDPRELAAAGRHLEAGQAWERLHNVPAAVDAYRRGNAWGEAARLLVQERRFEEAGDCFLRQLPVQCVPADRLDPQLRRAALNAGVAYARAGRVRPAIGIFVNLGEYERAAALLKRSGRREEAAEVMRGRPVADNPWPVGQLSALWRPREAESSPAEPATVDPLEMGESHARANRPQDALQWFRRVLPRDPRYAESVARVVKLVWAHELMSFEVDQYVRPFLRGDAGPLSTPHLPTLYTLARAYEKADILEAAEEALAAVLRIDPQYRDARERMERLSRASLPGADVYQRIVDEDSAFRAAEGGGRFGAVPGMHDPASLPSLPDLPAVEALPLPPAPARPVFEPLDFDSEPGPTRAQEGRPRRGAGLGSVPGGRAPSAPGTPAPVPPPPAPPAAAPDEQVETRTAAQPRAAGFEDADMGRTLQGRVDSKSEEIGLGVVSGGTVIAGRYRVESPLGEGGYAVVFKVTDLELEEEVALKLFTRGSDDPRAAARFKGEMKIARKLNHPNIVRTYEFGVWRNAYFITMEMLEGKDLEAFILGYGGPLPVGLSVELLGQGLLGLGAAHDKGVVHRDIKPKNLFVLEEGRKLKVMDFGIAKTVGSDLSHTRTGMVVGTPAFVAPERLKSDTAEAGPASDVYSMGVVLYQMLTGKLPFRAQSVAQLFMEVLTKDPEPPSFHNPDVPREIEEVALRLLAKDPRDRYGSCLEVKRALDRAWKDLRQQGGRY